jgi:hypothetical protein
MSNVLGKWSFIIGVVIAIILALVAALSPGSLGNAEPWLKFLLLVLSLIVGFVNITAREVQGFLVAAIAVLVAAGVAGLTNTASFGDVGIILKQVADHLVLLIAPAALVVSLRSVYGFAAE